MINWQAYRSRSNEASLFLLKQMKFKNEIFVVMVSVSGNGKAVHPIDDLSPITEVIARREFRNYREIGFFSKQ